mmetsp:Transcript_22942/g.64150  ORF Transcript_22942/g.64150 Transcript_22942/m.64150 type:complete len:230 (-) Transcript_22942:34-723(-)
MTFTPPRTRPSAMLSTATLLSDVARSGLWPSSRAKSRNSATETWVLPVPGGPWTIVHRRDKAAFTAVRCVMFSAPTFESAFRAFLSRFFSCGHDSQSCETVGPLDTASFALSISVSTASKNCIQSSSVSFGAVGSSCFIFSSVFFSKVSFIFSAHASTTPTDAVVRMSMSGFEFFSALSCCATHHGGCPPQLSCGPPPPFQPPFWPFQPPDFACSGGFATSSRAVSWRS